MRQLLTSNSMQSVLNAMLGVKVHIFLEGHKILRNLHLRFVLCSNGQIYGGDFAKFCGLLRIYEVYADRVGEKKNLP